MKKLTIKKIQHKFVAILIATVVVAAVVTGLLGVGITRVSTIKAINHNAVETAKVAALAAQNTIETYTGIVAEIGSNDILTDPQVPVEQKKDLIDDRVRTYYMRSGGYTDINGIDPINGVNLSQEVYFQQAIQGKPYMTTPYIAPNQQNSYLVVAAPIDKDGVISGIVYFRCDTNLLQSIVENIDVGDSEQADSYILDKEGTLIAYPDETLVFAKKNIISETAASPKAKSSQELAKIEQAMIRGETGVGEYKHADGNHYMQSYAPIEGTDGWSFAVTIDMAEFLRPALIGGLIQLIVVIILLIIGTLVAVFIGRSMSRPIAQCSERLHQLTQGDLHNETPTVKGQDEVRVLSDSIGQMVDGLANIIDDVSGVLTKMAQGDLATLNQTANYPGDFERLKTQIEIIHQQFRETIGSIVHAAQQVATGAEQVAAASGELASGSTHQTATIQLLTTEVSDLTEQIGTTAKDAQDANDRSRMAQGMLVDGIQSMDKLVEAVQEIERNADEIFKILKAIDDIAFQTNILSLNAAVEAARAGTAGKGFAVVADEVRNLAAKSAESAKTSALLINRSVEATHRGAELAQQTAQALQKVMSGAGEVAEYIDHISEEAQRQAQSIQDINTHITQISDVVQSNSAASEQSAETAEELSGQAELMKKLVGKFRLENSSNL